MRYAGIGIAVVFCLAAPIALGLLRAQPLPDSAGLWNTHLPEPPRQKAEWTPPQTALTNALVTATAELFRQGLADPRGCEYRTIVLPFEKVDNPHAQGAPPPRSATHGWVLPTAAPDSPRFAVCWNGLVYPVLEVGEPADLDADVKALITSVAQGGTPAEREKPPVYHIPFGDPYRAVPENQTVHQTSPDPVKVVILLRLGRADLAEALWAAATGWAPGAAEGSTPGLATRDPYLTIACDWTCQLLESAIAAHARGDDAVALATSRTLQSLRTAVEETQRRRAGHYAQIEDYRLSVPLAFLAPVSDLLADQERRARPLRKLAVDKDQTERIDALILRLDETVSTPDWGSGGSTTALVAEGDAAVPALLDCLEFDNRLTRVILYSTRQKDQYLHIRGVGDVAFETLATILGTSQFGQEGGGTGPFAVTRGTRRAIANRIREYWKKNRDKSPPERLFATLADDQASVEQWLDASFRLTRAHYSGTRYAYPAPLRPGGPILPMFGEPLRGKTDRDLSELLIRRVNWLDRGPGVPKPSDGGAEIYAVHAANDLALDLARWDIQAALPSLRERVARCAQIVMANEGAATRSTRLETDIAAFTLLRQQGGDPAALDDYAAWISTITPEGWSLMPVSLFEPLWRFADAPSLVRATEALFANPKSPWVPLFQPNERGWSDFGIGMRDDLICSPLLGVAPFRALVLQGLADDRVSSTVTATAEGAIEIQVDPGLTTRPIPLPGEPRIAPGSTGTLRLKDLYAWKLSGLAGFPRFEMYWPEPERDAAIARCVEFLDRYAERLTVGARRANASGELPNWPRHDRAVLFFEPLGHPATDADVNAGRAIFVLAAPGPGAVRTVALPAAPLDAEWVNCTAGPHWQAQIDASGAMQFQMDYNRSGQVWQAEEYQTESGWRRTYGFVGTNTLQGVPAEEVRFPGDWRLGWYVLSDTLDARLTLPGGFPAGLPSARVGQPLTLTLEWRNHQGVAVTAPAELSRAGSPLALRDGVSLRLFRLTGSTREGRPVEVALEPRAVDRFQSNALRTIGPADHFVALELDLRDRFTIDQPGFYRLVLAFEEWPTESGLPPHATVTARFTID